MKKSILFLISLFLISSGFAQKGKVTSALNLKETGKVAKAYELINAAIDVNNPKAEKSLNWPKTWEVRGEIYQAIFQSEDENVKILCEDPLGLAFESYKKALELDKKGKSDKRIKIKLTLLSNDFLTQAGSAFEIEDYAKSLLSFTNILEINSLDLFKADNQPIDTAIIFNAGIAAFYDEQYGLAAKYYEESAKMGYNGAKSYSLWAKSLTSLKDTSNALIALKAGFDKYPSDNELLTSLIQIYLDTHKTTEALNYLDVAIEQNPENALFHWVKATLFEKLNKQDKAIELYKTAIKTDETFFDAYYNLGVVYYNNGVNEWQSASDIPANENEKYNQALKVADEWFVKALPYMEKCKSIKPDNRAALESLKNIYYRLIPTDKVLYESKYNEIVSELKN